MLKLTRRVGESIVLTLPDGRTVTVTVVDKRRLLSGEESVRIGVTADRSVPVMRQELLEETP